MTEDEELINRYWPLIRTTVERYKPVFEWSGLMWRIQSRPVEKQIEMWMTLKRLWELVDDDVVEVAREVRREGLHGSQGVG